MIILIKGDGEVLGTLPYDAQPDAVLVLDLGTFEYDGRNGDDYVYIKIADDDPRH